MFGRNPRFTIPIVLLLLGGVGFATYRLYRAKPSDLVAAERAMDDRDFRAASEHLDRYLASHSDDLDARFLAARAARRGGDFATASAHLLKCAQKGSGNEAADLERRMLRVQQGGNLDDAVALMNTFVDRAAASLETALACEAGVIGILAVFSPNGTDDVLIAEADPFLAAARRAADRWLELRTGRADRAAGLVWRGRIADLGGDHAGALASFREALEVDPDSVDAGFRLAVGIAQAQPFEAATRLAGLRERRPDDSRVRFALANTYRALGRIEDATRLLDEELAANPNGVSALIERGHVALDAGRPAEAEPFLLRARQRDPELPLVYLALSRCMQLLGNTERAIEYQKQFTQLEARQQKMVSGQGPKK